MTAFPETKLDDDLVRRFMAEFVGYGNLDAPVWYVGMEEAGVERVEQARQRMSVWNDFGTATVDLREYHRLIEDFRCFKEKPEHQRTWRGLIRIHRSYLGEAADPALILSHQQHSWGRSDGDQALLELYPLPKRSIEAWGYHEWTSLAELRTPESYYETLLEPRKALLAELMTRHRPKFVVFYGKGKKNRYLNAWQWLAGGTFERDELLPPNVVGWRRGERTVFVAMDHTVAHGWKNEHFAAVGDLLRSKAKD